MKGEPHRAVVERQWLMVNYRESGQARGPPWRPSGPGSPLYKGKVGSANMDNNAAHRQEMSKSLRIEPCTFPLAVDPQNLFMVARYFFLQMCVCVFLDARAHSDIERAWPPLV